MTIAQVFSFLWAHRPDAQTIAKVKAIGDAAEALSGVLGSLAPKAGAAGAADLARAGQLIDEAVSLANVALAAQVRAQAAAGGKS